MKRWMLLLLALPVLARADTWTAASNRDGDSWRVDTASIKTVTVNGKSYRQVAAQAVFKEVAEDMGHRYDTLNAVMLFDCAGKLSANREEHGLLAGKPTYDRTTADDQLDFADTFPNGTGDDLLKVVCGRP